MERGKQSIFSLMLLKFANVNGMKIERKEPLIIHVKYAFYTRGEETSTNISAFLHVVYATCFLTRRDERSPNGKELNTN